MDRPGSQDGTATTALIHVTNAIALSEDELDERFIRSPGPGGQNVNKVETAVQLRFDAAHSPHLPARVYARLKSLAGRRMTQDGVIVITANRFRTRERNRADARERLVSLIRAASAPVLRRRATKPTRASRERRLEAKQRQSKLKKHRKFGRSDES